MKARGPKKPKPKKSAWETVETEDTTPTIGVLPSRAENPHAYPTLVRRLRVPGGWLYQTSYLEWVESGDLIRNIHPVYRWHPPVFVADEEH